MIHIYNTRTEDYTSHPNNYYIGRSKSGNILGNPFTHGGKRKSLAKLSFPTREQAIRAYEVYFDKMYGNNEEFTKKVNEIYEKYKNGEEVYLQCFCKPLPCHGDVIVEKLQQRLLKEKMAERNEAVKSS